MENEEFLNLITCVRNGDEEAARQLVEQFEPYLLRVIRLRLGGNRLRHEVDSNDIWQSILAQFFARVRNGEFELDSPQDLARLLTRMATNKIVSKSRGSRNPAEELPADLTTGADPLALTEKHDLVAAIRERLTANERWLFDQQKVAGRTWESIGQELQTTPDEARMRLTRALARVRRELGNGH